MIFGQYELFIPIAFDRRCLAELLGHTWKEKSFPNDILLVWCLCSIEVGSAPSLALRGSLQGKESQCSPNMSLAKQVSKILCGG